MNEEQRKALEAARARLAAQGAPRRTEAYERGAQMSPIAQGALTAAQGATFSTADELAGLAGPQYRDIVRGATEEFGRQRPLTAAGLEMAGGLATAPLTGPLSIGRGATTLGKIVRTTGDLAAQGALSGAGAAEGGLEERLAGAGQGAATGVLVGGGANIGGSAIRRGIVDPIASRLPDVMSAVRPDYARLRLAELLERDAQARMLLDLEPGQEAIVAARRLQKLGSEAPIAISGTNTLSEIDMLANLPGSGRRVLQQQQRRVAAKRGGAIQDITRTATGVTRSANEELIDLAKRQSEAAGPLYEQLRNTSFQMDDELKKILDRARGDLAAAQRTATRRGEPQVALRDLQVGDELPFAAADQLKRSLYGKAREAQRRGNNNEAKDLDDLRIALVTKLDALSPEYKTARDTFAGFGEMETALERGQSALSETAESLSNLTRDMTQSEREAFRVGAVDALRLMAGGQGGQTRLLNMYKEPELQGKLRAIFGNDFREFQRTILAQEELKKLERVGSGSQTAQRLAQAQDQSEAFDVVQASQAATSPTNALQYVSRQALRFGMPEEQRNRLARLLMLRDQPAQAELTNMVEFMRRRAQQQAIERQAAGRIGAFGAAQE